MKDNVTPLTLAERPVDPGVVALLEAMLEAARVGEMVALAGVAMDAGGTFGEFYSPSVTEHAIPFLAYTRVLQLRLERTIET